MFCPKCGKSDQTVNTYCRNCGTFLPDFDKLKNREVTPEDHLKANSFLNLLTAFVSLTLAVILYAMFLGKDNTPVIIYVVAGFLTAMTAWQIQTFWRTLLLKKHFKKRKTDEQTEQSTKNLAAEPTKELLNEADFSRVVPPSIVEKTTRKLKIER